MLYKISRPQLVTFCPSGAAHDQRVFLSSNNPTPCFGDTVDLICYYPDVMETVNRKPKYTATTPSWRVNGEVIFLDENLFDQRPMNQTSSRLRVRLKPANFTGNPVSFTCYLSLTSGGEDSASTVVDPQGMQLYTAAFIYLYTWLFQAVHGMLLYICSYTYICLSNYNALVMTRVYVSSSYASVHVRMHWPTM